MVAVTRRTLCALLVALVLPAALRAQSATETPEDVVRQYTEAMRGGEWNTAARLMHPEALEQFRRMLMPAFETDTPGRELRDQFFDGLSFTRIRHLSDTTFFERFFRGMMTLSPDLVGVVQGAEVTMVGHVSEGDDMAHVVYRMQMRMDELTVTRLDVMSVKRHGNTWRGLLTGSMEGLAAALGRRREAE